MCVLWYVYVKWCGSICMCVVTGMVCVAVGMVVGGWCDMVTRVVLCLVLGMVCMAAGMVCVVTGGVCGGMWCA